VIPSDYEQRLAYLERRDRERQKAMEQLQALIDALRQQIQGIRQAPSQ
jgi:prefoldin subunit 5